MSALTTAQAAQQVLGSVRSSGGATLSMHGYGTPTTGYGVACNGQGRQVEEFSTLTDWEILRSIATYAEDRSFLLDGEAAFLGAWLDTETDILWLDVTAVGEDRDMALDLARVTGEIAVWDFAEAREIRV